MTDDEQAIRAVHRAWGEAGQDREVDRILELVTDDCVFLMPGAPPVQGKTAVRGVYEQMFARWGQAGIEQASTIDEIIVAGDWAIWRGTDSISITPAGASPVTASGHGMGVLRRVDGAWKFARGINNMMLQKS
jgi:uncharacterized protein (TIGR02246 family)